MGETSNEAMVRRLVAFRRLQASCPHTDGWRSVRRTDLWSCMSCGRIAQENEMAALERWPDEEPERSEALGCALVEWER